MQFPCSAKGGRFAKRMAFSRKRSFCLTKNTSTKIISNGYVNSMIKLGIKEECLFSNDQHNNWGSYENLTMVHATFLDLLNILLVT